MWILAFFLLILAALTIYDLVQRRHAILRNFPIVGHFRYWLESIGPELRQYIVTSNDEERPFSRDQRRWIYASAKRQNNYFGFGTDNDLERTSNYLIIKQSAFPVELPRPGAPDYDPQYPLPCSKVLGAGRARRRRFRPNSAVNLSAMSFGSLSGPAIEALNRGAQLAGCLQNTGEGGVSPHHLHGGELIWQIGTGYFGCRTPEGRFDLQRLVEVVDRHPIRAIEIKLSQGAKPGLGGVLPGAKVSAEIAAIRGVDIGQDCISPSRHSAFSDVDGLLDFAETIAEATGVPVGIKSAVGDLEFWGQLAELMTMDGRGIDFITIDGGEGGTGAGPLAFTDSVAQPFKIGFAQVYKIFAAAGLHDQVVFIGSGKLGFPVQALLAFALGCDMVAVGREAMIAIGCIQAQRCHSGHCPTGVATQNRWLSRGLHSASKAERLAHYMQTLRKELLQLAAATGRTHPALVTGHDMEVLDNRFGRRTVAETFAYPAGLTVVNPDANTVAAGSDETGQT